MKNRCFILLLMLCASAAALAGPRIASWQTASGAKVLFVRASEIPMADVRVVFDAGSARDGAQWGLAGLTNGMLAEGANGLSGQTISERFDDVGARYGSGALRDMAWVSLRGITEPASLEAALTTLAQVLQSPDFPASALERERKRMLTGLKQREQDPGAKAEDAFYSNLYNDHPYGSPPQGNDRTLLALKREDVLTFYRRFYSARNAIIAIVGDLDQDRAAAIAEQLASKLPPGTKPPPLPPAPALNQTLEVKVPFESTQTHVWVGAPGMARVDPDTFPLYVGNHSLGGGGFVSRLYKTIRERRGLSYSVYSYFIPMRVTGPFIAALQTSNAQAGQALDLLVDTVQDYIKTGPSAAELEASKKNIQGGFPLRIDSNSEIVEYLVIIGFYNLPFDYLETYVDRVKAVSLSEIRDAYQRRLHPANLVKIIVGPERAETASALPAAPRRRFGISMVAALHSKAPGSVRIIGGQWRRTRLPVLDVPTLRPSGDRVRETLFNWLQPLIAGSRCLDLFAGTGVLGFEAASRGAREVAMVEQDHKVVEVLSEAARRLSARAVTIVNQDVLAYLDGPGQPFDIVFIDPPFAHGLWEPCMLKLQAGRWLQPGAYVFLETPRGITLSLPARWTVERSGRAGNVDYLLARAH